VTVLFVIPCVAFAIYAYQQQQMAHRALIGSYPLEFGEGLTERFVLWGVGFSPLTPLSAQANYLNSIWAGTAAMFFFSLTLFSLGETFGGWLGMACFFIGAVSTIRSWMTYRKNRREKALGSEQENS
jgi:hypothetical protein